MRILFVTLFFPPFRYSGAELYTLGLANTLQTLGHDVEILCAEDWENGATYWNGVSSDSYQGVRVHRVHLNWTKASNPNKVLYDSDQVRTYLDEFLADNQFDVVHVTCLVTLGIGVLKSVHKRGIPLVLTLTDFWFLCPNFHLLRTDNNLCDGKTTAFECEDCLLRESKLYKRLTSGPAFLKAPVVWDSLSHIVPINRIRGFRGMLLDIGERKKIMSEALELPDHIIAPSLFLKQMFNQHNINNVNLSKHGHDLSWLNGYSGKSVSDKLRFGYIGQIQYIKGIHILLDAFKRANLEQRATLDVFGDFNHSPDYSKELVSMINIDSAITLHGRYAHNELARILSDIDVLVVPSIWYENQPLVIQEAFATQTPVIATNLGGMSEAVKDGVNGLLFEHANSEDLAKKIRRFVNEPDLVDKLREGIVPVRKMEEEAGELEILYFELIKSKTNPES